MTEGGPVLFGSHPDGLRTPPLALGMTHPLVQLRSIDTNGQPADEGEFEMRKPGACLSAETVKKFALNHAPAYQHPRQVWFMNTFSLAWTNKIDRTALKRDAAKRTAKED
jgi:long-chain acyl-CoA synthetase